MIVLRWLDRQNHLNEKIAALLTGHDVAIVSATGLGKDLRREAHELKAVVAEQALELRLLKKA
jgi:hypothetical protein